MTTSLLDKHVLSQYIPGNWDVASLRWVSRRFAGGTPDRNNPDFWTDGDIPWVNSGAVNQGIIREPSAFVTRAALKNGATRWAPKGALLIALAGQGKTKGMVAQTEIDTTCNQSMGAICPDRRVHGRFLFWWLTSQYKSIRGLAGGDLRDGLNLDIVGAIPVPIPPPDEQRAIAAFLDRETVRIDALIEKKQRQTELLHERRVAYVSHVVTRGLSPSAPMKSSGFTWLGNIPKHWSLKRAKVVFREINERSTTGEEELLTVSHITGVTPRSEKDVNMFMAESLEDYKRCEPGDLVINTMWAWMGALGVARCSGIVSPSYNVYRFRGDGYEPQYYDHLFRTPGFAEEIRCHSKGIWISRLRVYPEEFFQIRLPCPPREEQHAIVDAIRKEIGNYDALQTKIEESIDRLREYRTALISAAVTGNVNVREEVAA